MYHEVLKWPPFFKKVAKYYLKMPLLSRKTKENILCSLLSIHFLKLMSSAKIILGGIKMGSVLSGKLVLQKRSINYLSSQSPYEIFRSRATDSISPIAHFGVSQQT